MIKRTVCFLLSLLLAFSLAACGTEAQNTSQTTTASSVIGTVTPLQPLLYTQTDLDAVAISTEHFPMSKGEFVYLFAQMLNSFLYQYSSYLNYLGMDPAASLKTQKALSGEGSWFDYFYRQTVDFADEILLFCEAGLANGITDGAEEDEYVSSQKKALEEEAAKYEWKLDTYLEQVYSTNLHWDTIEPYLRKFSLYRRTYNKLVAPVEFSDEELEAEYEKNKKNYAVIRYVSLNLGEAASLSEADKNALTVAFKAAANYEDFAFIVGQYLQQSRAASDIEAAGGLEALTKKFIDEKTKTGGYAASGAFMDWAFGEEAKTGGVIVEDAGESGGPYVYCLLDLPQKDTSVTVDVRHILFMVKDYGGKHDTAQAARSEAERVYQEWKDGGAGEDSFIELCARYSEDGNASSGGLYTGVTPGQMVASYNDWCFDESRTEGDSGIVDTVYGSHIMYFVGRHISWETKADDTLFSAYYEDFLDAQREKTPVNVHEEVAGAIEW